MSNSITLSPKHGVNLSVDLCFYCGEAKGVVLPGRLKGDTEAPREAVWDMEPCETCKSHMAIGVIFIEVFDGETGDNPRRTGRMWVLSKDFCERIERPDIAKAGFTFIPQDAARMIGLPDPEEDE